MERDKKVDKLHNMSGKEIKRLQSMTQLEKRQLTQAMAAEQLGISVRQVKRLKRSYQADGAAGLIHKNRGKPSHNQLDAEMKQKALDLILERYRDFGPTLAREKLVEVHGLRISDERRNIWQIYASKQTRQDFVPLSSGVGNDKTHQKRDSHIWWVAAPPGLLSMVCFPREVW